jgi:hypothetical protein
MKNNIFGRIKKTLAILLAVCFLLSVTTTSVSATENSRYGKNKVAYEGGYNKGYSGKNKVAYEDGYSKGYSVGKEQGKKDCKQYGSTEILKKIPRPFTKYSWTAVYKKSYRNGYKSGYIDGYSGIRYECLRK